MIGLHEPITLIARHAEVRIRNALADTRVVALVGPRQSGKTTLARKVAADLGMSFVTLDDDQHRSFARDDPSGFVRRLDSAVIDEIQRAPDLILALKRTVDEDTRPGRFLITGSVDLFESMISPDSLAGRVETIELLPFSQAEIAGRGPSRFLTKAFAGDFPALEETGPTPDLMARILTGGYPEALARPNPSRRRAWLVAYSKALATRDIAAITEVTKTTEFARLIDHAAVAASQMLNLATLAGPLGIDGKTVDRWLTLLEHMFVVRRVPAWHRNHLKRLVRTPKLHFLDSGLLAALRRITEATLEADRTGLGSLLEGFVFAELLKFVEPDADEPVISHFRDRDQVEVDFVVERAEKLVAIEVKASASVGPADLRGLNRLRDAAGKSFVCGILLHDGDRIQRIGDDLYAVPVSQLWA